MTLIFDEWPPKHQTQAMYFFGGDGQTHNGWRSNASGRWKRSLRSPACRQRVASQAMHRARYATMP